MSLTLEETGDNVEKNTEADTPIASNFTIVPDGDNGTFYAVISADELAELRTAQMATATGKQRSPSTRATSLNGDGEDQSVSTTFTYEEQDTSLNGGEDFQAPKGNSTVSGKTNLAPGTELSVVADSNIFYIPQDVTVSDDGTFSAKYNFDRDDVDNGTEFSVYVSDDEDNTKIGGVVNADMNDTTTHHDVVHDDHDDVLDGHDHDVFDGHDDVHDVLVRDDDDVLDLDLDLVER